MNNVVDWLIGDQEVKEMIVYNHIFCEQCLHIKSFDQSISKKAILSRREWKLNSSFKSKSLALT